MNARTERDSLGERQVPAGVYYGIQTLRATENFPISGLRPHPELVTAIALVKQAAADANMELGDLDERRGKAIVQAARETAEGRWREQFVVDAFQAGAGTSFNMNMNEVIANRAAELLGERRGDYSVVHPNDHVNMSQSSNDVFPTALRLAALALLDRLLPEISALHQVLQAKASEFRDVLKSGRTHLQDAVPILLGQEFEGYAAAVARSLARFQIARGSLEEIGLGGTAAGTGLNTHPRYRGLVLERLAALTGRPLRPAGSLIETTQSLSCFAETSACLKLLCLELVRIANDLRLLSSGPRTGLGEINLPPLQPGSSIMPGKVNPVMAEALDMVSFQVIGNDVTVSLACQAGQLELNVMAPVIALNLLQSLEILANALRLFRERCVQGITANKERCLFYAENSAGLATALNRYIGYEAAAKIARESQATGKTVRELVLEKGLFSPEQAAALFSPSALGGPSPLSRDIEPATTQEEGQ